MSARNEPESNEDYYGQLFAGNARLDREECMIRYGEETEAPGGKGTKTRTLTTKAFRKIQLRMLSNLDLDIFRNVRFAWVYGSPLPDKDNPRQPLGDFPEKP